MEENEDILEFKQVETNVDPMSHLRSRPNFPKQTSAPYIPEPKKKSKTPIIILLAIFFVILAGCGGFYFGSQSGSNFSADVCPTCENLSETSTEETNDMTQEYQEVKEFLSTILGENYQGSYGEIYYPAFKPEGLNSFVSMRFALSDIRRDDTGEWFTMLKNKFGDMVANTDMEEYGEIPYSLGINALGYINKKQDIFCALTNDRDGYANYPKTYISCAKTNWTWLTDEEKTLREGLEAAYYNKTGEYPVVLGTENSKITDSKTAQYQTTTAGISNAVGLFYRTSPESEWQFFTGTQAMVGCSEYNTADLKNAYFGEPCITDNGEESVV